MGFDNECILNISSLAGEYFCPVCRLLVYPNEALQSQCTHLYCKPCLSYVVSTTRACPYDGYLVTDTDSKPLLESNKTLAETIGKITVQCLYHRSGCTWQGALAECIAHCSGCTFGNSPVVCNRCGIQIVHRQVQEHAQNCVSVQPQGQQAGASHDPAATGTTIAATGTTTAAAQTKLASQAQSSQTTTASAPHQEPNQQSNPNPQSQGVSQAVVTSEQWFQQQQQQQQYQQYYQQYSGYESYYQQYYPYQQQTLQVSTAQNVTGQHPVYVQSQTQPQTQGQSQVQPQTQVQSQVQPQTQVQSQVQPQSQVQSQVQPQPQVQSQVQTQPQVQSQVQTQPKPQLQAQPQSHPSIPIPVATQTLNQAQLNKQQQTHLTRPPLSQIPSQTHLTAQGHPQPQFQPFPQAQPHPQAQTIQPHQQHGQIPQYPQHHSQLQQPQPHIYPTSQALPQAQLQPQPQESQPLNPNLLPQVQHPAAHAVTVNQSYPQPHPHPQMQVVTAQHPVNIHAPGALHSQQYSAQMHNFHPQMRPPQPHPTIPNQQQPGLLPSAGPLVQQGHHNSHQPAVSFQQRPTMQAVTSPMSQQYVQQQLLSNQPVGLAQAQMHQQGASTPQQQSFQSQLRPVGPPHSFQQLSHGYSQPQQNVAGSHAMHPHPSHNFGGRPVNPNHGLQSQPYPHSAAGTLVKPMHLDVKQPSSYQNNVLRVNNQSGVTSEPISEVPIDRGAGKSLADKEANSSSKGTSKEANRLNMTSSLGADVAETNTAKLEADLKSVDEKPTEGVGDSVDKTTKEMSESRHTPGTDLEQQGDLVSKNVVKGDVIKDQNDVRNGEPKEEEIKIKDGHLLKTLPLQEAKIGDEQNGKMQKDKIFPQDQTNPEGPALSEFRGVPGSYLQPPHSVSIVDQARHQTLQMPYGSNSNQQRPSATSLLQAPLPPTLPYQFRPQGAGQALIPPEHLSAGSFGRGPNTYGPLGTPLSGAPRTSKGESLAGPLFGTPPPSALDSHGAKSYGSDSHLAQRSANMVNYQPDNIRLDPRASGFESTSTFSLRDERLKPVRDERLNQLPLDHSHHAGDRGQFEEDLKQFPRPSHLDSEPVAKFGGYFSSSRPLDRGPHGFGMDIRPRAHEKEPHGFNFDPMIGSGPSRFLPPYPEDVVGRPDFHGTAPSYGRHHMDRFISRSPGREYPCISPRGFGGHPGDEIDGRKQRFNDRFSGFPGHLHRGAYEGSDHLEDRLRSRGMIGQDIRPPHFRRGEHFGHHSMPGHFRLGEPMPLGDFPGHERMGEFGGPGNFRHPRLGEPGFRSSFSLKEFRNDGGIYAGDMDSFENKRKRKSVSMGWCRICNVDCETVEGLDLHSQTREHQKMAMDLVQTIKQNAKKQKIDQSVRSDVSKSKISKSESRVNKH